MLRESIWPFAGRLFAWLPPCYAAWYFASGAIAWVQGGISRFAIGIWFPGLLTGWDTRGSTIEFATRIAVTQGGQTGLLAIPVDGRLYSFGLPLFVALSLASDRRNWRALLIGIVALMPFLAWGVGFDVLKYAFLNLGGLKARDIIASEAQRNLIALGYQLGTLILPAIAPVIAWGALHRTFLARWIEGPGPAASRG